MFTYTKDETEEFGIQKYHILKYMVLRIGERKSSWGFLDTIYEQAENAFETLRFINSHLRYSHLPLLQSQYLAAF